MQNGKFSTVVCHAAPSLKKREGLERLCLEAEKVRMLSMIYFYKKYSMYQNIEDRWWKERDECIQSLDVVGMQLSPKEIARNAMEGWRAFFNNPPTTKYKRPSPDADEIRESGGTSVMDYVTADKARRLVLPRDCFRLEVDEDTTFKAWLEFHGVKIPLLLRKGTYDKIFNGGLEVREVSVKIKPVSKKLRSRYAKDYKRFGQGTFTDNCIIQVHIRLRVPDPQRAVLPRGSANPDSRQKAATKVIFSRVYRLFDEASRWLLIKEHGKQEAMRIMTQAALSRAQASHTSVDR